MSNTCSPNVWLVGPQKNGLWGGTIKRGGTSPAKIVCQQHKSNCNWTSLQKHCGDPVLPWLIDLRENLQETMEAPWKNMEHIGKPWFVLYIYICPCKFSLKPILFGFSPVSESGCIMLYDIWNPHVLLVQPSIVSPVFADICNPLLCLLVRFTQGIFGNDPSHHW